MIQLHSEILCLILPSGERIPCSPQSLSAELHRQFCQNLELDTVEAVVVAVWHFFKRDLNRDSVLASEFAQALRQVLDDLGFHDASVRSNKPPLEVCECNLRDWITANPSPLELVLYPRLRLEVRSCLARTPKLLRIRGLKPLSQYLTGSSRWNDHCRKTQHQILEFLRDCLKTEGGAQTCLIIIE
jgi:hypothetical protein